VGLGDEAERRHQRLVELEWVHETAVLLDLAGSERNGPNVAVPDLWFGDEPVARHNGQAAGRDGSFTSSWIFVCIRNLVDNRSPSERITNNVRLLALLSVQGALEDAGPRQGDQEVPLMTSLSDRE